MTGSEGCCGARLGLLGLSRDGVGVIGKVESASWLEIPARNDAGADDDDDNDGDDDGSGKDDEASRERVKVIGCGDCKFCCVCI